MVPGAPSLLLRSKPQLQLLHMGRDLICNMLIHTLYTYYILRYLQERETHLEKNTNCFHGCCVVHCLV